MVNLAQGAAIQAVVRIGGLEPPTFALSEQRSNQLSYTRILFDFIFKS
jgi:hypothetical protein